MKLKKIARLASFMLVAVFLFTGCLSATYDYSYESAEEYSTEPLWYYASMIHKVRVHWYAGSITVVQSDKEFLAVREEKLVVEDVQEGTVDKTPELSDDEKMHWYIEAVDQTDPLTGETTTERTLHIQFCASNYEKHIDPDQKQLVVEVAQGIDLSIEAYNADVTCGVATLGDVAISTTAGNVTIDELSAHDILIGTVSGNISVASMNVEKNIEILNTSGAVRAESIVAESVNINNPLKGMDIGTLLVSGKAELQATSGIIHIGEASANDLSVVATSGTVNMGLGRCEKSVLTTENGAVILTLSKDYGTTLEFNTISGHFTCSDYSMSGQKYVIGNGAGKLKVTTSSGNLTIK